MHDATGCGQRYRRSSSRATERRCTSSGPSARRRVRACAYIRGQREVVGDPAAAVHLDRPGRSPRSADPRRDHLDRGDLGAGPLPRRAVSISHAVFSTSSRACSISIRDSAICCRTTPCSADGPPKAYPALRPPAHQLQRPLGHAERPHAVVDAAGPEPGLSDREAAAARPIRFVDRHPHVLEEQSPPWPCWSW